MSAFDLSGKRIFVAGHLGMVGSALVRSLQSQNCEILTAARSALDLRDQGATLQWLKNRQPHVVIVAAAKVGGILANDTYPADFLYDNAMIEANLIHGAFAVQVEKLLFLGSSCIYPKFAPQPIAEEALLTGPLEPTNEAYAIAKIAGIKLCQAYRRQHGCDFISAMPANLYGPGDNFDLTLSHVIPALIRKAHEAKISRASAMAIWGTGAPRREFLHVDDCANALLHLLRNYSDIGHVNVGSGTDHTIEEVARIIMRVVGFGGELSHDLTKPDGTPARLMSGAKLAALGWRPRISLEQGLHDTYQWFLENRA